MDIMDFFQSEQVIRFFLTLIAGYVLVISPMMIFAAYDENKKEYKKRQENRVNTQEEQ